MKKIGDISIYTGGGGKEKSRHKEGTVLAVGPGRMMETNQTGPVTGTTLFTLAPVQVKINDHVVFSFGEKYTIEGQEVYIIKESEVLAVLDKDK